MNQVPNQPKRYFFVLMLALLFALTVIAPLSPASAQPNTKISELGKYDGYSEPRFTEWVRSSQYVTVRDGTKLAVDIVRPSVNGVAVDEKLPVIYIHERYQRAFFIDGKPATEPNIEPFWSEWLKYGYVLASADIRGGGASYGTRPGEMMDVDSTDAYDVIEWLADQSWSSGRVGMIGISYNAITQFMAAGSAPPALRAIIPSMSMFDLYSFVYPGGIYRNEFLLSWSRGTFALDKVLPPVPVDGDTDAIQARAAVLQHLDNVNVFTATQEVLYRDGVWARLGNQPYLDWSINRFLPGVNSSNVAVYQVAGWFDMWPRDMATWFNNLTVPKRIVFTPFSHGMGFNSGYQRMIPRLANDLFNDENIAAFHRAEQLRFLDRFLKDVDNGIDREPPVWYYTMGAPAGQAWRSATQWPLPNEQRTTYYLSAGSSGSVKSANDGLLSTATPTESAGSADKYTVDDSTTTGTATRWHNGHGGDIFYGDMTPQDEKSLTYTTAPLTEDVEITGHPVIHLWVSSTATDGDFFAYIEEVDDKGYAQYITEGELRASHRKVSVPPYYYMGLPYHRSFAEDITPLTKNEPTLLVFDLHPTSNIFDAGHRIRIRIAGADADNYLTPKLDPAPVVSIYRSVDHASYIELPIIPAK